MPGPMNHFLDSKPLRVAMEKAIGLSRRRSLPHFTNERFDKWFAKHAVAGRDDDAPLSAMCDRNCNGVHTAPLQKKRGEVILWDDTFVRYHEPHIGIAAVEVLEKLGFEVSLVSNRQCCGRPAFSQGNLDAAAKLAKHNISQLLARRREAGSSLQKSNAPILFLEPSCWSMFVEDYRELKIQNAENIAARCFLFEKFLDDLLTREPEAIRFTERRANVLIHPHCHAKSIANPTFMGKLAERLPGRKATISDTACCGMAGAFGALAEKYDLSVQVAQRLLDQIDNQPRGVEVVASGTSCRHQISDLTNVRPKHMAELLAEAL